MADLSVLEVVLLSVVAAAVAFFVGKFLFQKDTEVENRRRAAAKLAGTLRALGLRKTPEFLEDYAVGDYSGMAEKIKELVKLFANGEQGVVEEFSQVFDSVLAAKLKSESGRAFVAAKLEDAVKETDVSAVKNAAKAAVV
jgi:ribosomal protein L30/L7E